MDNLRALRHEWFGREGLKPEEVEIFHRCCDELEQAIKADTSNEVAQTARIAQLEAEIERLKAELELTRKVRDQATKEMEIKYDTIWIYNGSEWVLIGSKTKTPDLYAELVKRGGK